MDSILRALSDRSTDEVTLNWISCLFRDRSIYSELLGDAINLKVKKGCPQDGVLSLLYFGVKLYSFICYLVCFWGGGLGAIQ